MTHIRDVTYLVHGEDAYICDSCIIAAIRELMDIARKNGNLNEAIDQKTREQLIEELKGEKAVLTAEERRE